MDKKPAVRLVMVTGENNNKFYDMVDNGDGEFTATWGRIGVTSDSQEYPIKQWDKKYREKIKKGYTDQSHLFVKKSQKKTLTSISNKEVADLIEALQSFANTSVKANYTVDASIVTKAQIDSAQQLIDNLAKMVGKTRLSIDEVNEELLNLYKTIPRKMKNVNDHLITSKTTLRKSLQEYLAEEQDTLDVMAGQVNTISETDDASDGNILDALGMKLEIIPKSDPEYNIIQTMMGGQANRLLEAYRVHHERTGKRFTNYISNHKNKFTQLYWHGSRNENWWNILQSGLLVRPTNAVITGKMFGYGIYGADKFEKSYGYTSGNNSYWARGTQPTAFLGIFQFHMGNTLKINRHQPWCNSLDYKSLKAKGDYDSLTALGGYDLRNNEYIVYQEEQLTIRYLIKVKG